MDHFHYNNTWINKSRDWHIDGVVNKSSAWFFMSTNLQKIPVKISSVDLPLHFDEKKTQCKLSNGLESATGTLLHQKQPFVGGMLSSNVVVQTLKMLNAPAGQMRYLHRKP